MTCTLDFALRARSSGSCQVHPSPDDVLEAKLLQPVHFSEVLSAINKPHRSPNTRGKITGQVKSIFKHAYQTQLIDRPANFGPDFAKPPQKVYREHENAKGDQSFTAAEIKMLLRHADVDERAMILLALQGGFGNTEIAELPRTAIQGGWIECPRLRV